MSSNQTQLESDRESDQQIALSPSPPPELRPKSTTPTPAPPLPPHPTNYHSKSSVNDFSKLILNPSKIIGSSYATIDFTSNDDDESHHEHQIENEGRSSMKQKVNRKSTSKNFYHQKVSRNGDISNNLTNLSESKRLQTRNKADYTTISAEEPHTKQLQHPFHQMDNELGENSRNVATAICIFSTLLTMILVLMFYLVGEGAFRTILLIIGFVFFATMLLTCCLRQSAALVALSGTYPSCSFTQPNNFSNNNNFIAHLTSPPSSQQQQFATVAPPFLLILPTTTRHHSHVAAPSTINNNNQYHNNKIHYLEMENNPLNKQQQKLETPTPTTKSKTKNSKKQQKDPEYVNIPI